LLGEVASRSDEQWHNAPNIIRSGGALKRHILTVLMSVAASVISGAIFVIALFHQFALVEVAASILAGLQVFFLSSAIGDLLDEKKEPNRTRNSAVVLLTIVLIVFYAITRYLH
jgi:hypothetical protein